MHAVSKTAVALIALLSAVVPALCQSQNAAKLWSQEQVQLAIAGCRASIVDHATRDYLARHNLAEGQLPANFKERIAPVVEPFLLTCDCAIAILSKEIPFERFQPNSPHVEERLKTLVSKGSVCEPKTGT